MDSPVIVISVISLVATSFVATNIDNLALLVGWLVARQVEVRRIFAGYMAGMLVLLVFSPLLADSRAEIDLSIAVVFLVVAVLWFRFAQFLSHHASRIEVITKIGRWIAPVVMIVVGLYILDNTATDMIAGD